METATGERERPYCSGLGKTGQFNTKHEEQNW